MASFPKAAIGPGPARFAGRAAAELVDGLDTVADAAAPARGGGSARAGVP